MLRVAIINLCILRPLWAWLNLGVNPFISVLALTHCGGTEY